MIALLLLACSGKPADTAHPGHGDTDEADSGGGDGANGLDGGGDSGGEEGGSSSDGYTWPVDQPGPNGAGMHKWSVTYSPGEGLPERTIALALWYPTTDAEGEAATDTLGLPLEGVLAEASLAPDAWGGSYPVVVHSHGYQGWSGNSEFLGRYFATHGWLFLAPDHTNNTLADHEDPLPTAHYIHRPLDIRAALDALQAEPTFGARAATDRVLLSGHSFGVYTSWAAGGAAYDLDRVEERCLAGEVGDGSCTEAERALFASDLSDPRVVATLPLAGSYSQDWFGASGYLGIQGPVMEMSGSEDDVGADDQWALMTDINLSWVEIAGGCHQTFGLGTCPTLDAETGFAIIDTYALAFARAQVLGDTDPTVLGILDGSIAVSELVTYQTRSP
jgi:predicted dienelactone hydrolase